MSVKERALCWPTQQREEFLLTMDIDQYLAELAQGLQRHRTSIDERSRAPVVRQYAPQNALAVALDGLGFEPVSQPRLGAQVEGGRDLSALRPGANCIAARAPAGGQREGVDDDGLARAGLPGQRGEARAELELDLIDDREIADPQVREHGPKPSTLRRLRPGRGRAIVATAPPMELGAQQAEVVVARGVDQRDLVA